MQDHLILQVVLQTDGNGNETGFANDIYGHLKSIQDAADQLTEYWYGRRGNRTRDVEADALETTFTYGELGRLRQESRISAGQTCVYNYDAMGNMAQSLDPRGTTAAVVFDNNRPVSVTHSNGAQNEVVQHEYDEAGFKTRAADNGVIAEFDTTAAVYEPDPCGRINSEQTTIGSDVYGVSCA